MRKLRIKNISGENFIGIAKANVDLGPLTVAYGQNGNGKTSLLDGLAHVLTGAKQRGVTLPELVRQGERSFDFDVTLETEGGLRTFTAHRAQSGGGELLINGEVTKEKQFFDAVREATGTTLPAISASLKAGALLEMTPAERQELLVALTGAVIDEKTIEAAFAEDVLDAAERLEIPLPTTLGGFAAATTSAEGKRVQGKRDHKAATASLANAATVTPEQAEKIAGMAAKYAPTTPRAFIENMRVEMKAKRDAALRSQEAAAAFVAGGRTEKIAALRARHEELAPIVRMPPPAAPDVKALKASVDSADKAIASLRAQIAGVEKDLAHQKGLAALGTGGVPADAEQTIAQLADLEGQLVDAKKKLATAETIGAGLKAVLSSLTVGADCPTCRTHLTAAHRADIEAQRDQAREGYATTKAVVDELAADVAKAKLRVAEVDAAKARTAAAAKVAELEDALVPLRTALEGHEKTRTADAAKLDDAKVAAAAVAAHDEKRKELASVSEQLTKLELQTAPAPATDDVAQLDAAIARGDGLLVAIKVGEDRAAIEARIGAAATTIADADLVAKACGPGGVRSALIAHAVEPFLSAANVALAQLAPGNAIEISADDFVIVVVRGDGDEATRLLPSQLSDGERTRLLYVLQLAIARLAGFPLLVLDRGELMDAEGNAAVKRLAGVCAAEGIQILMLSCKAAPTTVPAGITAYSLTAGVSARIPGAVAA